MAGLSTSRFGRSTSFGGPGGTSSMTALRSLGAGNQLSAPAPITPTTPTTAPTASALGPFGTQQIWKPPQMENGHMQAGGWVTATPEDYKSTDEKFRDQIQTEMMQEQLRQAKMQGDAMAGYSVPGLGVPQTGTTRASSSSMVSGGSDGGTQYKLPSDVPDLPQEPQVPGSTIKAPTPTDREPYNALAYGAAKDRVAQEHSAALKGLRSSATARGISGTGIEHKDERALTRASLGALRDVAAQQAGQDVSAGDTFLQSGYQGGITQRGQDINAKLGLYNSKLAGRGQTIGALRAL